ncbi:MAG: VCBS repeat-containing protein [Candidatus Nanopelagicales bacterium]
MNNQDGTFTRPPASVSAWPKQTSKYIDRHGCDWADVNADGRMDAYCSVGRTLSNLIKGADYDNELWFQQADGSFVDRGTKKGVGDPYGRGKDSIIFDANGDGRLDIYSMNSQPRDGDPDAELTVNKLFIQRRNGDFHEAPRYGLDTSYGYGMCGWATDWDFDGDQDLFVCGTDLLYYFQNNGDEFESRGQQMGIGRDYADCELADIDDDGDLDIVGVRSGEVAFHANQGDGTFASTTLIDTVGHLVGATVADANGDGLLDVAVARGTAPPATIVNPRDFLYLNQGDNHWQRVPLPPADGAGTDVQSITVLPGELPRFLVGNGNFNLLGPVQLLSIAPEAIGPLYSNSEVMP